MPEENGERENPPVTKSISVPGYIVVDQAKALSMRAFLVNPQSNLPDWMIERSQANREKLYLDPTDQRHYVIIKRISSVPQGPKDKILLIQEPEGHWYYYSLVGKYDTTKAEEHRIHTAAETALIVAAAQEAARTKPN